MGSDTQQQELRRYRPYPAYKDSGVEWLGEIPKHWEIKRLRSTVRSCQNGVWGDEPDGLQDIACIRVADFDRVRFRTNIEDPTLRSVEPKVATARGLKQGDLLLEKSGGGENQPVGAIVLYDHAIPAVCSNFIARVALAKGFDSRFMTYLHAALYLHRINTKHIKQSTGIQNLDSTSYLDEAVGLPIEHDEQRTIAGFLDRETARIDALVTKKQQLIELLQEQRTALITRAVTKGLDPSVPMKDSGVEWLGEIPEHWDLIRLRSTVRSCQNGVWGDEPDGLHDIACVRVADFDRVRFRANIEDPTLRSVDPKVVSARGLQQCDLLLEKSGGGEKQPVGAVVLYDCDIPAVCSNFVARVVLEKGFDSRFMTYLHAALYSLRINTRHIKQNTGIQNLDSASYLNETVGLPLDLAEQHSIATYLDQKTAQIDVLVDKILDAVAGLQELRAALISAAVTGKIDVREEVA